MTTILIKRCRGAAPPAIQYWPYRTSLGERFRRGKLQKACDGHYQGGKAPYGYRYIPRQDVVPGHLVVDEGEAAMVRSIYGWLIDERTTIRLNTPENGASKIPRFPDAAALPKPVSGQR